MSNEYTGKKLFHISNGIHSVDLIIDFDNRNLKQALASTYSYYISEDIHDLKKQLDKLLPLLAHEIIVNELNPLTNYEDLYKNRFPHLDGSDGITIKSFDEPIYTDFSIESVEDYEE